MMKYFVIICIFTLLLLNCGSNTASNVATVENIKVKTDTIIPLNKTVSLHYASFNKDMKLWYNMSIINNKKEIRVNKETDYQGTGSELFTSLSPNSNYVVVDSIIKGYVFTNDKDSTLHENYTCSIIDLKSAKIVKTMQEDCGGKWTNENQWVSSGGKVVFE